MINIVPTVVPNSLEDIVQVGERYQSFFSSLHVDVADGVFAPNTTWLPASGETLPPEFSYDVHLMVQNPAEAGLLFANAGAKTIIGHVEAFKTSENARNIFETWRNAGVKTVGVAALLQTPLETLEPFLPLSDIVLLMTIAKIGVQGIPFEEEGIEHVVELHARHPEITIAVDGGVSGKNIARLAEAGASYFSVGSAIAKSPDPKATYQHLLSLAGTI